MILEAIFNGEIYPAETVVPKSEKFREAGQAIADIMWCCIIKVDTLFSRILIYNHNQYENRRKTYGTESKIL